MSTSWRPRLIGSAQLSTARRRCSREVSEGGLTLSGWAQSGLLQYVLCRLSVCGEPYAALVADMVDQFF